MSVEVNPRNVVVSKLKTLIESNNKGIAKKIKLDDKSKPKNPIFIVGMPRSGSSLI